MKADKRTVPDETLVPDARAGMSPEQIVNRKLDTALGAPPQAPKNSNPPAGKQDDAARRPARASER